MLQSLLFVFNSVLLGVGLAMDAFSVSLANGLAEPEMPTKRMCLVAGTYAFFQGLMPMTGWACVHTVVSVFSFFQHFIPWIALALLLWIGGKMLREGLSGEEEEGVASRLTFRTLMIQGIATSIDALSVGFTISEYGWGRALVCSLIIAAVTFVICHAGLAIGKRFGTRLAGKATVLGGAILIFIGLEIWVSGVFF